MLDKIVYVHSIDGPMINEPGRILLRVVMWSLFMVSFAALPLSYAALCVAPLTRFESLLANAHGWLLYAVFPLALYAGSLFYFASELWMPRPLPGPPVIADPGSRR
jgi:hypothetical protein